MCWSIRGFKNVKPKLRKNSGQYSKTMLANTPTPTGNLEVSRMSIVDTVETLLPTALTHNSSNNSITISVPRVSSRNKRVPTTMTKDFLW
jgi:hypothetical protein